LLGTPAKGVRKVGGEKGGENRGWQYVNQENMKNVHNAHKSARGVNKCVYGAQCQLIFNKENENN